VKRIGGHIKKADIKLWLENYQALQTGDRFFDAQPTNSGPKSDDGISGMQLNKIMLDQAIEKLDVLERACILARYVHQLPLQRTLEQLEVSDAVYYQRCRSAIDSIYRQINGGDRLGAMNLVSKIIGG
jgi:DNA-directed RNA polymerase specialized sigma24 family protein